MRQGDRQEGRHRREERDSGEGRKGRGGERMLQSGFLECGGVGKEGWRFLEKDRKVGGGYVGDVDKGKEMGEGEGKAAEGIYLGEAVGEKEE